MRKYKSILPVCILAFSLFFAEPGQTQLLGRVYETSNPDIGLTIIPIRDSSRPNLTYQLAFNNAGKSKNIQYAWGWQTMPPLVMTGFSYRSKNNHVYGFQTFGIKRKLNNHMYAEILVNTEQFFSRRNSALDLHSGSVEGKLQFQSWNFTFSQSVQKEQIPDHFIGPLAEIGSGSYRNKLSAFSVKRNLTKSLFLRGSISVGESYQQRRNLYKLESAIKIEHLLNLSVAGELNQFKSGNNQYCDFVFLFISTHTPITRDITARLATLFNQLDGITGSLASVKLERDNIMITLEYRALWDSQFKRLVVDSPFFSSTLLFGIEVEL